MNPQDFQCPECGAPLASRGYKHRQRVGKYVVTDESACIPMCPNGHEPDLTFKERLGYERRAVKMLLQHGAGEDGGVMRFARRTLGLKQTELATLLEVAPETVSRWETGANPAPLMNQLAVASLVDRAIADDVDVLQPAPAVGGDGEITIPFRAAC